MPISEEISDFARVLCQSLARAKSETGLEGDAIEVALSGFESVGEGDAYIDEYGNAVLVVGDGQGPTLLLDAHADSIPLHSAEQWSVNPFGGEIINDRVYGLGICDQKASIAAMTAALRSLLDDGWSPKGRVVLVASASEEQMEGAALAPVVERYRPDFAVTTEPSDARLFVAQRGRAKIELVVRGRAAHAGHAVRGINAALFAARVICLVGDRFPKTEGRKVPFDINCIDVLSDPYPSVSTVPGSTIVRFDARFGAGESKESVLQEIETACQEIVDGWSGEAPVFGVNFVKASVRTWKGFETTLDEFAPAWSTDADSELVLRASSALAAEGLDAGLGHYSFCTNGSLLSGELGIATVGYGVGAEDMAHRVDEHVTLDSLNRGVLGLRAIILALLS